MPGPEQGGPPRVAPVTGAGHGIGAFHRARGLIGRAVERDQLALAPLVDEATAAELRERGLEGSIRVDTPGGAAAAEAVSERH